MSDPREKWECPICEDIHSDEDDAAECCPREGPRRVWECDHCGEVYATFPQARECCPDAGERDPMRPTASPAELEMAGQSRLEF